MTTQDHKPTILVVDDEEGPRTSIRVVFQKDYNVLLASNGKDGIALAIEHKPDVAILDILMSGMSGVDVLRELKSLDEDIEVIMLTAYETLETARQALRLGAREYLNKPFDISVIRNSVSKAVARRGTNLELKNDQLCLAQLRRELADQTPLGDAASSIVHDLNNPLTVINGFVELIHRQVQNAASLYGEELERMRVGISRIHTQVGRCLEISRRYLGTRRRLDPAIADRISVNDVLTDLNDLLLKHPSAEGNELHILSLEEPHTVAIHGTDLLRILLNLTTNALQSSDTPHRVEVTAQHLPAHSDFGILPDTAASRFLGSENCDPHTAYVAFIIRDTGPGIPADIVPRLFHEQLTTKPTDKGHGLGLGSVQQLVLAAKGALRLTTKIGEGTQFTVFLPLAEN